MPGVPIFVDLAAGRRTCTEVGIIALMGSEPRQTMLSKLFANDKSKSLCNLFLVAAALQMAAFCQDSAESQLSEGGTDH